MFSFFYRFINCAADPSNANRSTIRLQLRRYCFISKDDARQDILIKKIIQFNHTKTFSKWVGTCRPQRIKDGKLYNTW